MIKYKLLGIVFGLVLFFVVLYIRFCIYNNYQKKLDDFMKEIENDKKDKKQ